MKVFIVNPNGIIEIKYQRKLYDKITFCNNCGKVTTNKKYCSHACQIIDRHRNDRI